MKILHCITSLDKDGAQRMLYRLATQFQGSDIKHVLVNLRNRQPLADDFEKLGIKVYSLGMSSPVSGLKGIYSLRKIIVDESPDILHSWLYHANCAVALTKLTLKNDIPLVWGIRGSLDHQWLRSFTTAIVIRFSAYLSRIPKIITYNSRISIDHHRQIGYANVDARYMPNGFELERFKPDPRLKSVIAAQLKIDQNLPFVGIAGRYDPSKDYSTFVRSFARVLDTFPDAQALMMGRDVDSNNKELTLLIDELKIGNNVHLMGPQSDLSQILPALDVFCSSSITEGFPNVVAEALACAVPCVVTDVGMSAEIVADSGITVSSKDVEALAQGICTMLSYQKEKRIELGTKGREKIVREFDLKNVVTQHYYQLYQDLFNQSK